jgi:hypothetical protein
VTRLRQTAAGVYEPVLTEAEFQRQVVKLARSLGWETWHPQIAVWSKSGWPDLVLCKPPRLLFWELKTDKGKTSADQDKWLADLRACGQEARVVRPADRQWIHETLLGRSPA